MRARTEFYHFIKYDIKYMCGGSVIFFCFKRLGIHLAGKYEVNLKSVLLYYVQLGRYVSMASETSIIKPTLK